MLWMDGESSAPAAAHELRAVPLHPSLSTALLVLHGMIEPWGKLEPSTSHPLTSVSDVAPHRLPAASTSFRRRRVRSLQWCGARSFGPYEPYGLSGEGGVRPGAYDQQCDGG